MIQSMINANEARFLKNDPRTSYKKIVKLIKNAAMQRKACVWVDAFLISDDIKERLMTDGFIITYGVTKQKAIIYWG